MEPSGAAHQPRALGTANPARILACLSLLRRLRARARPSRPTTFSDNMCALDDDARGIAGAERYTGTSQHILMLNKHTHEYVLCVPEEEKLCAVSSPGTLRCAQSHDLMRLVHDPARGADAMPSQEGRRSLVLLYWPRGI